MPIHANSSLLAKGEFVTLDSIKVYAPAAYSLTGLGAPRANGNFPNLTYPHLDTTAGSLIILSNQDVVAGIVF